MTVVVPDLHTAATQARASRSPTIPSLGGKARSANLLEDNDGWIDGKFRLLEKLGEGGFGLVYKAEQVQPIHRLVAVKILKAGMDTQQVIARFDTERQSLALMEHPNIARVLDAGETERGQPYFVMELVRGRSVTSYAREKRLTLRQRIELFIQVCQAVNHAHQKGIIHRDLKPSNVMVMEEDGVPVPKVIDFGIAKVLEQKNAGDTLMTGMDQLVGTPGYISPEQIEHGSSHVDTRSDVYALGSILLELLSGRGLVSAADLANRPLHQILRDQVEIDPPRPSSREPALKGDLDWIILKALERDPARRYGNADDLADDLRRYLHDQPVRACPPSRGYLIQKFVRRHRVGVSAAAAVSLAVLAGAVTSTMLYLESEKNRQAARKASSVSDGRMAAQLQNAEPPDYHSSTALLCRALRTDPGNLEAASNLLSLLEHGHLIQPATSELPLPAGVVEARLIAVSRQADKVLAVSKPAGDGREILSLWSMSTGQREDHELPQGVLATVLVVSKDGSLAYLARDDGQVMRWNLKDGSHGMMTPQMPVGSDGTLQSVLSMTESGDGRTLAAGGDNGSILVWNVGQPEAEARVLSHPTPQGGRTPILSLTMDYLGTIAATASNTNEAGGDGVVRGVVAVWDLSAGQIIGDLVQVEEGVSAVAVHREKELLAIGLHGGGLHVLNFRALEEAVPELKHPSAVTSLAFNSDASTLVVGDGGGHLHAWDMSDGRPRFPAQRHDGEIMALASSPERGVFVSVSRHGEVQVWDSTTGARLGQRLRHSLVEAAVTPDASLLAMAPRYSPHVQVWRIHQRMTTRRFLAGPEEDLVKPPAASKETPALIRKAAVLGWNANRSWVAAADAEGRVQVMDAADGRPMGPAVEHPPAVGAVALSGDGRLLVTSGRDQEVRFWDARTGTGTGMVIRFEAFVSALALSQDGGRLVTVTDDGEARVWDTADGGSLTPPFRLGAGIDALFVKPDAGGFIYRLPETGWFELPMPAQAAGLPGWFLDLAEAQARRRLTPEGRTDALTLEDWRQAVKAVPHASSGTDEAAHLWARWLLAAPQERALSPRDEEPLSAYLDSLEKRGSQAARAELGRFRMELVK
ncbi:MAG: Serine/threonine-protein kinase PknD [Prosthecobacter sp.]|nr:Serine/threonine-protein kinase PknD [Prosthecobacter sp.]